MRNKSKKILLAMMMTCSVALIATGCDKLKKEPETEKITEAPTEKPTEKVTEAPTEKPTEPPTEKETEPPTESETQPKELTVEEEKAQEKELDQIRTLYAKEDINVRLEPGKGDDIEIFSSFLQGDQIMAVGETPNWYVVNVEDYDVKGYVNKEFVSEEKVEPLSEEERQKLYEQMAGETTVSSGEDASGSAGTDTSATDAEFGVELYAEEFPVSASTGANMRTTPAQDGEIIDTIASGTTVTAIGYTDRWYKVNYNGNIGYVNKNLFSAE